MRGFENDFLLIFCHSREVFHNVCIVFENLLPGHYNFVYVRGSEYPKGVHTFDYVFCGKWSKKPIRDYYMRYLEKGTRIRIFDLEEQKGFLSESRVEAWIERKIEDRDQGKAFREEVRRRPLKRCITI